MSLSSSVFVHVVLPGQEPGAQSLDETFKFPTMQEVGEDLSCVLDHLNIPLVTGLGEGAGANILARSEYFIKRPCPVSSSCLCGRQFYIYPISILHSRMP